MVNDFISKGFQGLERIGRISGKGLSVIARATSPLAQWLLTRVVIKALFITLLRRRIPVRSIAGLSVSVTLVTALLATTPSWVLGALSVTLLSGFLSLLGMLTFLGETCSVVVSRTSCSQVTLHLRPHGSLKELNAILPDLARLIANGRITDINLDSPILLRKRVMTSLFEALQEELATQRIDSKVIEDQTYTLGALKFGIFNVYRNGSSLQQRKNAPFASALSRKLKIALTPY